MMTLQQLNDLMRAGDYFTLEENRPAKPMKCGLRSWFTFFSSVGKSALAGSRYKAIHGGFDQAFFSSLSLNIFNSIEKTGATITVENCAELSKLNGKPCIYAANHMSLIETFLLPGVCGAFSPVTVVAKKSLTKYPIFGECLRAARPILLERKNARKDLTETITQGKERVSEGISILLFPQGARTLNFNPKKFNSLASKLAREAEVPLVPIACKTDYALPGKLIKDFGPIAPARHIKLAIGPILQPTLSQSEMQDQCISFIQTKLNEWGAASIDARPTRK